MASFLEKKIKKNIIVSFGIHTVVFLLVFAVQKNITAHKTQDSPIEVTYIEEIKLTPKNNNAKSLIVDSSIGEIVDRAKDDAYLGEKNRVVDIQKVLNSNSGQTAAERNKIQKNPRIKQASKKSEYTKFSNISKLGLQIQVNHEKQIQERGSNQPEYKEFLNNQGEQAHAGGEYIKGLKEGEATALNTREFVFFSYFKRIRSQLDQAWQPILRTQVEKIYRRGRQLASEKDHVTKTIVTLDTRGEVVKVQVLEDSGTQDLDDAAVKAFNQAGPFPNPPKGMFDQEGKIQIRWDFVLKT